MAFADFDWATDTNYPAGSETWSATPTKVAPSAGVQADGFAPTDQPPAQWINWLFNGIITAGQDLETAAGDGSLQHAWERSETLGSSTPHIDITGSFLRVGAATPAIPMIVVNEAGGEVFFGADLDLYTGKTLTLPSVAALLVTGAGAGGRPKALIQTSGVGGETNLESGAFTPTISATTGSGVASGDFTSMSGHFARVGQVVFFSIEAVVNTTGWTAGVGGTATFDLPVSGTISGTVAAPVVPAIFADWDGLFLENGAGNTSIRLIATCSASVGGSRFISASGSYLLA